MTNSKEYQARNLSGRNDSGLLILTVLTKDKSRVPKKTVINSSPLSNHSKVILTRLPRTLKGLINNK